MIDVSSKKRIVLKLGTSTLTHKTGKLNIRRMTNLVRILSDLHNAGKELLLVSSGAVGMGVGKLNLPERPKDTPSKQAAAAVGQCELMHIYDDMFSKYNYRGTDFADTCHPDQRASAPRTEHHWQTAGNGRDSHCQRERHGGDR